MPARILMLDVETAPNLGYTWAKWDTNVIEFVRTSYFLSFAYKWFGSPAVVCRALPDYPEYQKDLTNDSALVRDLWGLLNECDIVVAHNGDAFDIKKSNARFITHNLVPPSSYKSVDTLKLARKHFKFESNKLTDLGQSLDLGQKLTTTGWALWKGCMAGDMASWDLMRKYNIQDVNLLEQVYLKLRPWATTHPDVSLYSEAKGSCPTCGSGKVQRRGKAYAISRVYQRMHCTACGSWYAGDVLKKTENEERFT